MPPSNPVRMHEVHAYQWLSGTASSQGANEIIAAVAGGGRIMVQTLIVQEEEGTGVTAIWQNGAGGEGPRVHMPNEGDGAVIAHPEGKPWRLTPGNALVLDLSAGVAVGYSVYYKVQN